MRSVALLLFCGTLTACNRVDASSTSVPNQLTSPAGAVVTPAGVQPPAEAAPVNAVRASFREVTLPAGTAIPVVLDTSVGSDTSRVEQAVRGHLGRSLTINGVTAFPRGTAVSGVVTDASRSAKVKGRAHVGMRFNAIDPAGPERYRVQTRTISALAPATKKKDAVEILGPAAGGALIGGLVGGKKGALVGTAAGGGAGTAVVLSTRGKEVHFARGSTVTMRLTSPLTIRVGD